MARIGPATTRLTRLRNAWRLLDVRALRLQRSHCPLCGANWLLTLDRSELGVRCLRCGASAVTQSLAAVVREQFPDLFHDLNLEVLDIPDDFEFMAPELVTLIQERVEPLLADLCA